MPRVVFLTFALVAFGCASVDRLHPTFEEFAANIHYPYYATTVRQGEMKHGAHLLRKGMTEAAVLQLMGQADYKMRWFDPVRNAKGQVWVYVVTWERRPTADYHGKTITISLEDTAPARTLLDFDASAFGVRRHE